MKTKITGWGISRIPGTVPHTVTEKSYKALLNRNRKLGKLFPSPKPLDSAYAAIIELNQQSRKKQNIT